MSALIAPKTVWQRGSDARLSNNLAPSAERSSPLDVFVSAAPATNAMRGPLARSLQTNPYEFFDARWLSSVVRQVVRHTNKRSRATAKNANGAPRVSVLLNLRMRVDAHSEQFGAQEAGVVLESCQMLDACGADDERKVALITLILRPTDEALLARQLRSRLLPLGAAARFALRPDELPAPPRTMHAHDADDESEEDRAIRSIFVAKHGKHGDKVHNALCMQPTVRVMLAHELSNRTSVASALAIKKPRSAPRAEHDFVVPDEDSSSGRNVLAALGTDSSSYDSSSSSSSSNSIQSGAEAEEVRESEAEREAGSASSEPSGISLDGTESGDSEDDESDALELDQSERASVSNVVEQDAAQSADSSSSSNSSTSLDLRAQIDNMFSESIGSVDGEPEIAAEALAESFEEQAADFDEPEQSEAIAVRDTRFNEFMWLRALVHQRSFTLGFELTHQAPYIQYRQQLRRVEVPQSALPASLEDQLALPAQDSDDEDKKSTLFMYMGRAAQLRSKKRGARLLHRVAYRPIEREPEIVPLDAVPLAIADNLSETDGAQAPTDTTTTLLDELVGIDWAKVTLYEMEVYARARLEALLVFFCNSATTRQSRRYPQHSGADRNTLSALPGATERESAHQAIGLLVMLLAAAHNEALLANLFVIETLWHKRHACLDDIDAEDGAADQALERHLDAIDATHAALPDQFALSEGGGGATLLKLLNALAREWTETLNAQQ